VQDSIETRELKIVDSEGRVRIQLSTAADSTPRIYLFDENATVRMSIGIREEGNNNDLYIDFLNANGKARRTLLVWQAASRLSKALPADQTDS
jgi:hypothetical protein